MSEKAPEQTTIQWEVLFPLANARHKNTHSCISQSQWKGRHHRGREKTEPERKTNRICESVCVCVSLVGKNMWDVVILGVIWLHCRSPHKPQWLFRRQTPQSTCCNYALLLCCDNVNHIMCLWPHTPVTYLELARERAGSHVQHHWK